jgi:hypothetical protein
MSDYFNEVSKAINGLTDEEFNKLLKESGLDKCPLEKENTLTDRNKERCKDCMFNNYAYCPYIKVDGGYSLTGRLVREYCHGNK